MTQSVQFTLHLLLLLLVQFALNARNVHAKGLVGKLPGNPASCQEEPCNSDPQHVLAALKVMCMFLACVFILPLILYYLSKMFTKIRGVCCPGHDEKGPQDCDDDDGEQVKQRERTASSQANNNLCGSIAVISNGGGGGGKDRGQFQLNKDDDNDDHRKSSESNQNGDDAARQREQLQQEQLQQLITSRHQSLVQYGANPSTDSSGSHQPARNQAHRESQRAARRQQQQRNSIARMPGDSRGSSRPTPPPQPLCENIDDAAEIDAREEAAMMEAYTRMHPHRYSMYFGSGGGGPSGMDGCAVGVAAPASLLSNQNPSHHQRAIDHKLRPNKSMRGGGSIAARHQLARVTNPMSTSSIKRKKGVASGGYKIHPVQDDGPAATGEGANNKQPLARADAIDDQQAHYCSPGALSHRQQQQQQLLASDQQNNSNDNNNNQQQQHHHQHQRLRAGQSSPYAGVSGGGGNFPFTGPDKTNNNWTTGNLEVPSARPEHRHSIDGSILNNMLASGGNMPTTTTRLTPMDIKTTMTTRQQQQQAPSPISRHRERPEPFGQLEYQQQVSALPNGHIDNQQQQHMYQGRETNNGAHRLGPASAVDARNTRRASLSAAALMCSPSDRRGQFY